MIVSISVNHSTFEETAYLLIFGELPNSEELNDFTERMTEARSLPSPILRNLVNRPKRADPMDVIQSSISELQIMTLIWEKTQRVQI